MNILLIDDDADCLDGLATVLEPAGHNCNVYTVPEVALAAYQKNQHHVVITDMKMPGLSGIDVLKKARLINPEAKVIIATGYGDVETAVKALNNGAYAFFGKPINLNELMDTLDKIECEISGKKKDRIEHARLTIEYNRLKKAYEDLLKLLRKNSDN